MYSQVDRTLQQAVIDTARAMAPAGLNRGTAGNVSVRAEAGFYITPTGLPYDVLAPEDIPWLALDAEGQSVGHRKPSSEWRFHLDLYRTRPDIGAIVHAHAPFAVTLACLRQNIPPFHYMIARFGGSDIRCAPYAIFGSQALSTAALQAMENRKACLLANHGLIAAGKNLQEALALAIELEELCEQYWRACQLGPPVCLNEEEMSAVLEKFSTYGQQ